MKNDVIVIGAGAIGSFLALGFSQAGQRVAVMARGSRLAFLRENGLVLEREGKVQVHPVFAAKRPEDLGCAPMLVLCTKTLAVPQVLSALAGNVAPGTIIVTTQNGVETPDMIASAFPEARVVAMRVHGFFEMHADIVRHTGVEPSCLLGAWHDRDVAECSGEEAQASVAARLREAGIGAEVASDIRKALWDKFLLAAAIGGVGTALAVPAGSILQAPGGAALLEGAMREIALLARRRGIALVSDQVERTLGFVAGFPADATSSLQRDLESGQPGEYDALTGAALRMAREEGLATPLLDRVASMIRARGLLRD